MAKAPTESDKKPPARAGRVYKSRKQPVTFTVEKDLLEQFDALAERAGVSRAAALALAMGKVVRSGL